MSFMMRRKHSRARTDRLRSVEDGVIMADTDENASTQIASRRKAKG